MAGESFDPNLPRVAWELGQTLLPKHLMAQEDSILATQIAQFQILGLPFYGIETLKWELEKILQIQKAVLVFPKGQFVASPGNATLKNKGFVPLNSEKRELSIYAHLLPPVAEDLTNQSEDYCSPENSYVRRERFPLEFSSEEIHTESIACLKIAEIEKDIKQEGKWILKTKFYSAITFFEENPIFTRRNTAH